VELEMGQSETRTFELANIGEQSVNFYINAEQTYPPRRDLSDAYAFCEENYFTPGETTDWTIGIFNGSTDEWITDLDLDFPYEVTVNSATDATGGSGGDLVWNGTTGTGANINWHGVTPYELGVVQSGDHAYLDINVTISESIAGNLHIPWTLTGDQYGAEPHTSSGEFILHSPLQWISLDTSSGTLDPDESIEITMNFDTSDIPAGLHSALITITSDSWDTKFITVDLNVISNDNNGEELPEYSQLLGNYPNPFNPETTIKFYTTEGTENTEINIYNIKGQLVRELRIKNEGLRINSVVWDGKDSQDRSCASGIYFCRIKAGLQVKTQKMLLLK
jgi:hypothetical protein